MSNPHQQYVSHTISKMAPNIERRLPPSEVNCKWWLRGYCSRGKSCHFKHDDAMFSLDNKKAQHNLQESAESAEPSSTAPASSPGEGAAPEPVSTTSQTCVICFETPETYGLLVNCDHAFCLDCIRSWRATAPKNPTSENELKKTSKTCPMCRSQSHFTIPSSVWPVTAGSENTMKKEIVDGYLGRMKNIPCRYFEQSAKDSAPDYKFKCQFGNNCHYSHTHPDTKEPYVFSQQELKPERTSRRADRARLLADMAMMEMLFSDDFSYGGEDWLDEVQDDDDFGDQLVFEAEFTGLSYNDIEDFGYDYGWE
ncbi:uncharacterized protein PAC_07749 [Phialocephala subalpina]|uniref:Uncharacterized protein n=1 Tax=Phialocephala subalpina TaxID=576137 RepID=A0A1L7WYP7_9HELO|nr:uncharacterized protein PAC_07749 [Phialocephala subalpina]